MMTVDQRLSRPLPEFEGKRVFIVGSGTSLDLVDLGLIRDQLIWALNAAITLFADAAAYPGAYWFLRDKRAVSEVGPRLPASSWPRARVITTPKARDAVEAWARRPTRLYIYDERKTVHERTVAEDALQVARLAGCSEAVLVGVDCHAPPGRPYAKALSWKPCAWYNVDQPVAQSLACASMLKALRALAASGRLGDFKVTSTSETCEAFPFMEYARAVSGEPAPAV
jgi:hypothetical protein